MKLRTKRRHMYRVAVHIEGAAYYDVKAASPEAAEALAREQARFSDVAVPTLNVTYVGRVSDDTIPDLEEV